MKIIGNTVGMGLPKPNLMQTDPAKGDYVKGKEQFLEQIKVPEGNTVEVDTTLTKEGMAADAKSVGDALDGKISNQGTEERPSYNNLHLAFLNDIPSGEFYEALLNEAFTQASGYVDTEIGKLEPLIGTTEEITPAQVLEALTQGRMVVIAHTDERLGTIAFNGFYATEGVVLASGLLPMDEGANAVTLIGAVESAEWFLGVGTLPSKEDIPTDDHINSLINTALGVIENGTY